MTYRTFTNDELITLNDAAVRGLIATQITGCRVLLLGEFSVSQIELRRLIRIVGAEPLSAAGFSPAHGVDPTRFWCVLGQGTNELERKTYWMVMDDKELRYRVVNERYFAALLKHPLIEGEML